MPERPGLRTLLDFLQEHGFKMAVVSSTHRAFVERNLATAGIRDRFAAVVCGDMVNHSTPSSDIYLRAAGCHTVMVPNLDAVMPEMERLAAAVASPAAAGLGSVSARALWAVRQNGMPHRADAWEERLRALFPFLAAGARRLKKQAPRNGTRARTANFPAKNWRFCRLYHVYICANNGIKPCRAGGKG